MVAVVAIAWLLIKVPVVRSPVGVLLGLWLSWVTQTHADVLQDVWKVGISTGTADQAGAATGKQKEGRKSKEKEA